MQIVQKNKITMVAESHKKLLLNFSQAEKDKNLKARAGSRLLQLRGKGRSDKAEKEDYENDSIQSMKNKMAHKQNNWKQHYKQNSFEEDFIY